MKNKRHSFTLLELFICLMVIAIAGGVLTWQVKGMLDKHRLSNSAERLLSQFRELQSLALSYQTDMEIEISHNSRGLAYRIFSEEPLLFLRQGVLVSLEDDCDFAFINTANKPVRFIFFSSGWIEPNAVLEIEGKKDKLWIDLSHPLQIKLCQQKPLLSKENLPDRPRES